MINCIDGKIAGSPYKHMQVCQMCKESSYTWEIRCKHSRYQYQTELTDQDTTYVFNPHDMYLCDRCFNLIMSSISNRYNGSKEDTKDEQ